MAREKRCPLMEVHEPHPWKERRTFVRQCPGLKSVTRAKVARRRGESNGER